MKVPAAFVLLSFAATLTACSNTPQDQQKVREDTARTTATLKSDVKGMAEGIRDGLRQPTPGTTSSDHIDINTADRAKLETLPGITRPLADRIIAHRPYHDPQDLKRKGILTASEYDRISPNLAASH